MRIAVLGAGAIGAYVGAAVHRGGADVSLIARGPHMEAMRRDGVRVISPRGDFHARVPATDDPSEIGTVDYVLLGLKAQDYASVGLLLEPLMGSKTSIVAAQNGVPWWYFHAEGSRYDGRRIEAVDPGGAVSAVLTPERAIGCVVYCSTELDAPGVVRHVEGTRFSIGEPDRSLSKRCASFAQAMSAGGLKCPVERDIRNDVWIKLMGNVAFNPLSALTRATMVEIAHNRATRELVIRLMEETLSIAAQLGYEPEVSVDRRLTGAERVGHHKTSMLQDLEAGKRLELEPLIGAVVELAALTGTPAPALRTLHAATDLLNETTQRRRAADTAAHQTPTGPGSLGAAAPSL
jgi:2-dehydropantoate 2-reductase